MDVFSAPHFTDEDAARAFLERVLWPEGPVCPHCGVVNHAYATKKPGVFRCAQKGCRKDFTVTTKTVMERSHISLHKWLQAFHLMCSSKKGISAHQLHRTLKIAYQSAWFMSHRIRECMRAGGLAPLPPMGGPGKIVEADETYYGRVERPRTKTTSGRPFTKSGKAANKRPIVALVERGGNMRTFHVPVADQASVMRIVSENIASESRLHTDESKLYFYAAEQFEAHKTVKHTADEYVRTETEFNSDGSAFRSEKVHTNSAEGYFSIFKRVMRGVYQHCAEKHLHRYLAEYDFRYNHRVKLGYDDGERAALAIKGAEGKRLTYRGSH
jgi:transposase-like protein